MEKNYIGFLWGPTLKSQLNFLTQLFCRFEVFGPGIQRFNLHEFSTLLFKFANYRMVGFVSA